MSYVLRHRPEAIGITLDDQGWTDVATLIEKSDGALTNVLVREAVAQNDKQRFALSQDGQRIRANQGHSKKVKIDLGLAAKTPPEFLFHGTATKFIQSIRATGLRAKTRQHVHLSKDHETAIKVGQRHGEAIVLKINAHEMHEYGHMFFLSENGVWLTAKVPVAYISFDADFEEQMKTAKAVTKKNASSLKALK